MLVKKAEAKNATPAQGEQFPRFLRFLMCDETVPREVHEKNAVSKSIYVLYSLPRTPMCRHSTSCPSVGLSAALSRRLRGSSAHLHVDEEALDLVDGVLTHFAEA